MYFTPQAYYDKRLHTTNSTYEVVMLYVIISQKTLEKLLLVSCLQKQ